MQDGPIVGPTACSNRQHEKDEVSLLMEIARYMEILWRRKWLIAATLLATLAVVAFGTARMSPLYSASALVRLTETRTGPASYSDLTYAERLRNTYVQLLESRPVLDAAAQQLGEGYSGEILEEMVDAQALPSTELIRITADGGSPQEAADIAGVMAQQAIAMSSPPYVVSMVGPPTPPPSPDRPRPALYMSLAALLGLLGGLGLAFLFERLDGTIHSAEALRATAGAPLLGWVPSLRLGRSRRNSAVLVDGTTGAAGIEAFRHLGANILARISALSEGKPGAFSLLVTSPEPRAGKSTVLANLAVAIAQEGRRVVVVGSDLRNPSLEQVFGVLRLPSGTEPTLASTALEDRLVWTRVPGVRLLPSQSYASIPRQQLEVLVDRLAESGDVVLFDSPAALASADAAILAPLVDGVLLVVAKERTTDRNLALAQAELEAAGGRVLGVILNRSEIPSDGSYYDYRPRGRTPVVAARGIAAKPAQPPHGIGSAEPSPKRAADPEKELERAS
jgi:capsular exopolysaccharide synthesis family protein